jgi:hypothetical protein
VNEWLLFNTNSAIFQLYHSKNKLIFNEMMMMRSTFYSVSSLKQQSAGRPGTPLGHIILIPRQPFIALSPYRCMLSGEASNTNFIVFGFTWSRLKPTIYHTRDEHTYPRSTTLETSTLTHDLPHSRRAHLPLHHWCGSLCFEIWNHFKSLSTLIICSFKFRQLKKYCDQHS